MGEVKRYTVYSSNGAAKECVDADCYDALRAENAELKRDADRWRFYREGYSNPAEVEANVDAAMEAATQPTDKP